MKPDSGSRDMRRYRMVSLPHLSAENVDTLVRRSDVTSTVPDTTPR